MLNVIRCSRTGHKPKSNKPLSSTSRCDCKAYATIVRRDVVYVLNTLKMARSDHNHELDDPEPRTSKHRLSELSAQATQDMELLIDCDAPVLTIKRFIIKVRCKNS